MSRKNRNYDYADASYQLVGTMQCCACGKKITEGPYRYHETADAYVPCHRACCPDDKRWKELDDSEAGQAIRHKEYCADVLAFYDKWGGLDDDDFMSIVNKRSSHASA
ncbi:MULTISPECIES: hypothetical protein [unclassified Pseudomonas]|uniref:hypothetical protein n=1 Tax=unclassified Pseudomonas TaxID=196821 RepID=UPI002B230BC0|nr:MULTISPECIES: hypothetical protein [unclassified Pseudomonas]MEB0133439.1 hypothetical protein [Pseudomonas sp. CCI2.4]MEB0170058.1 hypothetical protein [Pseudomonas sp. CCC4.4]